MLQVFLTVEFTKKSCISTIIYSFVADFTAKKHLQHINHSQVRVSIVQDLSRLRFLLADLEFAVELGRGKVVAIHIKQKCQFLFVIFFEGNTTLQW